MNPHLTQEQFSEWLLGTEDREIAQHLEGCDSCRLESATLRAAIADYRHSARQVAERDEAFWARQRNAIASRIPRQRFIYHFRWAAIAAMVLLVFAALVLTHSPEPPRQAKNEPSDDILLQQVENSIGRSYPTALAPAVLIDEERSRVLSDSTAGGSGTRKNSNNRKEQQ